MVQISAGLPTIQNIFIFSSFLSGKHVFFSKTSLKKRHSMLIRKNYGQKSRVFSKTSGMANLFPPHVLNRI